jgi:histone H4
MNPVDINDTIADENPFSTLEQSDLDLMPHLHASFDHKYGNNGAGKSPMTTVTKSKAIFKRDLKKQRRNISVGAIRRLARKAGCVRMTSDVVPEAEGALRNFLHGIIKDAVVYTEYAKRSTVQVSDVIFALKRNNKTLYGFGE